MATEQSPRADESLHSGPCLQLDLSQLRDNSLHLSHALAERGVVCVKGREYGERGYLLDILRHYTGPYVSSLIVTNLGTLVCISTMH